MNIDVCNIYTCNLKHIQKCQARSLLDYNPQVTFEERMQYICTQTCMYKYVYLDTHENMYI